MASQSDWRNLSSAWADALPEPATRTSPTFTRRGLYFVYCDHGTGDVTYNRPCVESRRIEAHPDGQGRYQLWFDTKFTFAHDDCDSRYELLNENMDYESVITAMRNWMQMCANSGFKSDSIDLPSLRPRPLNRS